MSYATAAPLGTLDWVEEDKSPDTLEVQFHICLILRHRVLMGSNVQRRKLW